MKEGKAISLQNEVASLARGIGTPKASRRGGPNRALCEPAPGCACLTSRSTWSRPSESKISLQTRTPKVLAHSQKFITVISRNHALGATRDKRAKAKRLQGPSFSSPNVDGHALHLLAAVLGWATRSQPDPTSDSPIQHAA
jgi:hypothetical protein